MNSALAPARSSTSVLREPAEAEVASLAASIDVRSPSSIAAFGKDLGGKTASYADALLSKARSGDLDDAGDKLNEIIASTRSFDLNSLDNAWARTPIIGVIFRKGALMKEKAVAKFATVKAQVDKVAASIEVTSARLTARAKDFDAMYEGVQEEHESLTLHMRAAERRLTDLTVELQVRQAQAGDAAEIEFANAMEASRQALEKRVADLGVLRHSAMQTLPMIRVMQSNNLLLIDKFQTIQKLTLPAWKRTFTLALALNEQRDAASLANNIDDATNYLMRRNAELLHDNAVATAKTNQRLVIDVETLREVHDKLIQTFEDVRNVHQEGAQARARTLADLEQMRTEMVRNVARLPDAAQISA